jgi:hypothetical protein
MQELAGMGDDDLIPVQVDGQTVYIAVRSVDGGQLVLPDDERQISARVPRVEDVLSGIAGFATKVVDAMQTANASKVSVQFGCEFAIESGSLVAVVCKASTKSTMMVSLEWAAPSA